MNVKIHYDKQTKEILKEFKGVLREYEKQLRPYVDKKTFNWTCSRDISDEFWNDSGRQMILTQIAKVKKQAIPLKIEIVK